MGSLRKVLVILLLGFTAGASSAATSRLGSEAPPRELKGTASSTFGFLHPLWGFFTSFWIKAGCGIDPLGGCAGGNGFSLGAPQGEDTNEGCRIDPLGGCGSGQ